MLMVIRAIYIALLVVALSNASSSIGVRGLSSKATDENVVISSAVTTHGLDNNNDKNLVKSRQLRCVRCYEDQYQQRGGSESYYGRTDGRDSGSSNWYYYDRDRYDDRQRYGGEKDYYNRYDDRDRYSERDRYSTDRYNQRLPSTRDYYDSRRVTDPRDGFETYGVRGGGYYSQRGGGYDSQRDGYESQRGGYDSQRGGSDYPRGGYDPYRRGYGSGGGYDDRYGGRDTFYDRDRQYDGYDRYGSNTNRYRNNYYPYDDTYRGQSGFDDYGRGYYFANPIEYDYQSNTYRPQQSPQPQHYPSPSQSTPGPPYIPSNKSSSQSNSNSDSNDGGSSSTNNSGNWKYNDNQNNDKHNKQSQYDNDRDRDRDSQSSSYGGRRPLGGSYLLDRESNDPQKAVNNEKPSDGSMAMAQTMESNKDEKKE